MSAYYHVSTHPKRNTSKKQKHFQFISQSFSSSFIFCSLVASGTRSSPRDPLYRLRVLAEKNSHFIWSFFISLRNLSVFASVDRCSQCFFVCRCLMARFLVRILARILAAGFLIRNLAAGFLDLVLPAGFLD